MQILLISPYHGGSHQAWASGYQHASRHDVELLTLPARFWKWRMHGGAVTLARRLMERPCQPDLLLATDMLDLTTFLALTRTRTHGVPTVLYMHENQLTYPLPTDPGTGPMRRQRGERDLHYAFVNYASMLAADTVLFNSSFHRDSFFDALPRFLRHYPEYNELNSVATLRARSRVIPVGINLRRLDTPNPGPQSAAPPLILWNQRWEYDKNPAAFFRALYALQEEGVAFRLALCGERYGRRPPSFVRAQERLAGHIVHDDYANSETYRELLWEAAVTVSTAHHEFFGISILEAIYARTLPILPNRLSYPELIPQAYHAHCLYNDKDELLAQLRWALGHGEEARSAATELATTVAPYDWSQMAPKYDLLLEEIYASRAPERT